MGWKAPGRFRVEDDPCKDGREATGAKDLMKVPGTTNQRVVKLVSRDGTGKCGRHEREEGVIPD